MRTLGFLLSPMLCAGVASAQTGTAFAPVFAHDAVTCMSTEAFPIVEATIDPAEATTIREAKVYFKAESAQDWYTVDMEPGEGSNVRAFLPKPLAETARVEYYVFFLTGTFGTSQSEQYTARVSDSGCDGVPHAAAVPSSITLGATVTNQPVIPLGFQSQGISGIVTTAGNTVSVAAAGSGAASGGVSAATVGIGVGAGAAATGAVVVATGDEEEAGGPTPDPSSMSSGGAPEPTNPTPAPSPMPEPEPSPPPPAPVPSVPDVSGRWFTTDRIVDSCEPSLIGRVSDTASDIEQDGTRLSLSRNHGGYRENHTGTIDAAGVIKLSGQFVDDGESGTVRIDARTTDGTDMEGTRTHFYPQHNCTIRATFTGSKR